MKKNNDLRTLTRLALLVAIELVMKAVGLGSVPMGPLYMSFLTLPIHGPGGWCHPGRRVRRGELL